MKVEDLFDHLLRLMNSGLDQAEVFGYEGEQIGIVVRNEGKEVDFFETGPT